MDLRALPDIRTTDPWEALRASQAEMVKRRPHETSAPGHLATGRLSSRRDQSVARPIPWLAPVTIAIDGFISLALRSTS
jgi:hypothetical protein